MNGGQFKLKNSIDHCHPYDAEFHFNSNLFRLDFGRFKSLFCHAPLGKRAIYSRLPACSLISSQKKSLSIWNWQAEYFKENFSCRNFRCQVPPSNVIGLFLQTSSSLLKPLVSKVVVNCKHLITILWSVLHQFDQSPLKNLNCFVFFKKTEDFLVKILLAKNVRFQVSQYTSSQMWIKQHKTFCT